ncbi:hypothetical protein [Agreia sp. COWG]|uniref:hypothetical protein n=1 Tax=Agreia sp. COWG TaxID=2773266 RepID=UPI00192524E8|nr:hypothetical protein [Agreia sp. COWG]CAD6002543.1 conserved exported protein of unknown function [Agreia sp. COWG]
MAAATLGVLLATAGVGTQAGVAEAAPTSATASSTAFADVASLVASAATPPVFDAGYIISDALFYDGDALDAAGIQHFLDEKVAACSPGVVCLADYRQSTVTREADDVCRAYRGKADESAAEIIAKVGHACGISQKALLVLVQKEQGLVLDPAPTTGDFSFAAGYACPDTATCDTEYSGFYNQVYWAAWQLKRYANPPGTSEFFTTRPIGTPAPIAYNPDQACGAADVTLMNIATAALYYYTPYQPNPATVAGAKDDPCGAYGNLNFWTFYSEWFGDPKQGSVATGALEGVTVVRGRVVATGWAIDPSSVRTGSSVRLSVTDAAGRLKTTTVGAASGSDGALSVSTLAGAEHGFNGGVTVESQGLVRVCATALPLPGTSSAATAIGCMTTFALTP